MARAMQEVDMGGIDQDSVQERSSLPEQEGEAASMVGNPAHPPIGAQQMPSRRRRRKKKSSTD
eukprot:795972-Prorocentrum_lima.AAC.1